MEGWDGGMSQGGFKGWAETINEITNNYGYGNILPCGCPDTQPVSYGQCSLNQPLSMVIPPEGVHLSCPVHYHGHHIYGPRVHC